MALFQKRPTFRRAILSTYSETHTHTRTQGGRSPPLLGCHKRCCHPIAMQIVAKSRNKFSGLTWKKSPVMIWHFSKRDETFHRAQTSLPPRSNPGCGQVFVLSSQISRLEKEPFDNRALFQKKKETRHFIEPINRCHPMVIHVVAKSLC